MHTKYYKAILILVLLLSSCQTVVKPKQPDHFLSREQMIAVLIDIAEVKSGKDYNSDLLKEKGIRPSAYIYEKHGIDSIIYQENNQWYASRPKVYHTLFLKVKARLEAKKEVLDAREKRIDFLQDTADSIAMAMDRICSLEKQAFGTAGLKLSNQPLPLSAAGFQESLRPFFLVLAP